MLGAAAPQHHRLDLPRAIDDPRQPRGEDVEKGADAAEQEHRRKRQPDDGATGPAYLRESKHTGD